MLELCYTSIAQGLDRGKTGFTTAGRSAAMSRTLAEQAEKLSGFSALNQTNPLAYASEPVNFSHLVSRLSTGRVHIISRKGACPPDYTGRSNFVSHHCMLTPEEAAACRGGPAALAGYDGLLMKEWQGEARTLQPRSAPAILDRSHTTAALAKAGLDAGWAEALADRLRDPAVKQTWLIYGLDMDILGIVTDVLSHLEPAKRWETTFATHVTRSFPGPGVECQLQCVVAGTDYAREIAARQAANTFDLTQRGPAPARRPLATPAQPVAKAATAARGPLAAPVGMRDRSPAAATPSEEPPFGDLLAYAQTAQPMPRPTTGRSGFGWPWVAIPMAFATALACLSALLGYQWFEAHRRATQLMADVRDLKDEWKDEKKALKEEQTRLVDELASLKEQIKTQRARNESAERPLDDTREPRGEATNAPAQPAAAQTAAESSAPPPAAMPAGGQAAANPGDLPPRGDGDQSPPHKPAPRPAPPTGDANGPRINPNLIADVGKALGQNKKTSVTLLTGLLEPPASHAIEVLPGDGVAELLEARIDSKREHVVSVLGKQVAKILHHQDSGDLKLEIMSGDFSFLLKYLTIRFQQTQSSPILDVPLGKPINARLSILPKSQGDRDNEEKEKSRHFRLNWTYVLFGGDDGADKDASEQLGLLLECKKLQEKNLVEHFEFADKEIRTSPGKQVRERPKNTFSLYTTGTTGLIGVQFERKDVRPLTYQVRGWYVPLRSANEAKYGDYEAFDIGAFSEIGAENARRVAGLKKAADAAQASKAPDAGPKADALKKFDDKIRQDQQAWFEAKDSYPTERLRGRPVRLTLKPLDSEGGIVVVDSLDAGPQAFADTSGAGQ